MKVILWIKNRIVNNWQTTLCGILLFIGFHWYSKGKINWADFKEYLVLIPTIILLLMKDFKKNDQH